MPLALGLMTAGDQVPVMPFVGFGNDGMTSVEQYERGITGNVGCVSGVILVVNE